MRPLYMVNNQEKIFTPVGNRNNHGHDTEERVNVRTSTHGEEVVKPYNECKYSNRDSCIHH